MTVKAFLELCKKHYYEGNPIISDSQYDAIEDSYNGSLNIGTNAGRIKHWYKMHSLQKYYTDEDRPGEDIYFVTPKLDGAALAIRYIRGMLDSVVTRGNGEYGEDVTHLFNPETSSRIDIPFQLDEKITVQVTGEIVAPSHIKNARNYAAGALNLKDTEEFKDKVITFFAYDMQETSYHLYVETLAVLANLGFNTVSGVDTEDYPKDGKVFRVDNNKLYEEMGYTSKHPRGAFAVKERSSGIETTILDVVWQTGKSGKVTPVALLDPIDIDGAQVSRATLNNPGFIEALGVEIGDKVMVERAGGIIPRIIRKAE